MITVTQMFRAIMITNGDRDPGDQAEGMLQDSGPVSRTLVEDITRALNGVVADKQEVAQ